MEYFSSGETRSGVERGEIARMMEGNCSSVEEVSDVKPAGGGGGTVLFRI